MTLLQFPRTWLILDLVHSMQRDMHVEHFYLSIWVVIYFSTLLLKTGTARLSKSFFNKVTSIPRTKYWETC